MRAETVSSADSLRKFLSVALIMLLQREASTEARKLMNNSKNGFVKIACQNILGRDDFAHNVIKEWAKNNRPLVLKALYAFDVNYGKVTNQCKQIILRWEKEIGYQATSKKTKYPLHIIKAMSHPALEILAWKIAGDMLKKEESEPGFLGEDLKNTAEYIKAGNKLTWNSHGNIAN